MAIKQVVCVFDSAAQLYGQPFFVPAIGSAIRSIRDEVNRSATDNPLFQHPSDFELFHVGTFDDVSGVLASVEPIVRVARCKDLAGGVS